MQTDASGAYRSLQGPLSKHYEKTVTRFNGLRTLLEAVNAKGYHRDSVQTKQVQAGAGPGWQIISASPAGAEPVGAVHTDRNE
jgi:hypothetical protein